MLRRLATCAAALAIAAAAPAQMPFEPVPGSDMVQTSDFGSLPREIVWKKDGARMVLIPGGESTLGRPRGLGVGPDESPEVQVTLPTFYIDKFEVSNDQYRRFAEEVGATRSAQLPDSGLTAPDQPVTAITWGAASEFARWAQRELPTEAMWEKAARGPGGDLFTTGSEPDFSKIVANAGRTPSVPVSKDTGDISGYGVFHMSGNVREWVYDFYGTDSYATAQRENPRGPADGITRSVRGGSYQLRQVPSEVALTKRSSVTPTETRDDLGFRTVFVLRRAGTPTPTPVPTPKPVVFDRMEAVASTVALLNERQAFDRRLPDGIPRVSPADRGATPLANFSPYDVRVAFIGANGGVAAFGDMIPAGQALLIGIPTLPQGERVHFAASPVAPEKTGDWRLIGEASPADGLVGILEGPLFAEVRDLTGKPLAPTGRTEPRFFYGDSYRAQWDEVDLHSSVKLPLLVTLTRGAETIEVPLEEGHFLTGKLTPGDYRVEAVYLGTTDPAMEPMVLKVDDGAIRRQLRFSEDTANTKRIRVFTRNAPMVKLSIVAPKLPTAKP
ncbi:MAG: SUMF1/EgtB/PvdO family nonheme iron enzyme [Candidatus Sumerlaeia bacterium]|nr:SUMF1/EgtB/PvdO family nonheme iron enzyme [Candidatus Sumerlaeia bacterium]